MCIGYAFRPDLSSRLTWSGRTFLQKPTYFSLLIPAFSLEYSPPPLSLRLHPVFDALLPCINTSQASVYSLAPLNFRRRVTRPVSYYALFK